MVFVEPCFKSLSTDREHRGTTFLERAKFAKRRQIKSEQRRFSLHFDSCEVQSVKGPFVCRSTAAKLICGGLIGSPSTLNVRELDQQVPTTTTTTQAWVVVEREKENMIKLSHVAINQRPIYDISSCNFISRKKKQRLLPCLNLATWPAEMGQRSGTFQSFNQIWEVSFSWRAFFKKKKRREITENKRGSWNWSQGRWPR